MKAIMYHYVRPGSGGMPYFRYLHLDDFRRQLDHFAACEGFVSREAFFDALATGEDSPEGVVLTFDDGFSDHYSYVLPEIRARNLWGIFYVPTGPYRSKKLLDVHRIHILLGTFGGPVVLAALEKILSPDMLSHDHVAEFRELTYSRQDNDEATAVVKRTLNYFISYAWQETVLDRLMNHLIPDEATLTAAFHLTPAQIREMLDAGMIIGSHSVSHPVFSKLDRAEQKREIDESFAVLDDMTGGSGIRTFCYPYGGFHSFTAETETLLDEAGCRFSFNVEPRDIDVNDLKNRCQALPRYDCNMFPYGKARIEA